MGDAADLPLLVSVVVPCRNAAHVLARQLLALSRQDHRGPWEVVVVDNGSTDDTVAVALEFRNLLPGLSVVSAGATPGVNRARNAGARAAKGELVLLCDADDEVDVHWLSAMAEAWAQGARLLGGVLELEALDPDAPGPAGARGLADGLGFLPYAEGANCGFAAEVFERLGGFDERYQRGGDEAEFFWRAQLAGYRLHHVPDAVVSYTRRANPRAVLRQAVGYGRSHPRLYRQFHRHGMPRRRAAEVARDWAGTVHHAADVLRAGEARHRWLQRVGVAWGRLQGSAGQRTLYL